MDEAKRKTMSDTKFQYHRELAEKFQEFGNFYKASGKYEKAETFYHKSVKHLKKARSFAPQETESSNDTIEDKDAEVIRRMEDTNRKMAEDKIKFRQWQQTQKESTTGLNIMESSKEALTKFGNYVMGRSEHVGEIGVPINVVHEGHIGFDGKSGGLQTYNPPKEYKDFFENLEKTLKSMGMEGLTVKEYQYILKHPLLLNPKDKNPAKHKKEKKIDESSFEAIEETTTNLRDTVRKLQNEIIRHEDERKDLESQIKSLEEELSHFRIKDSSKKTNTVATSPFTRPRGRPSSPLRERPSPETGKKEDTLKSPPLSPRALPVPPKDGANRAKSPPPSRTLSPPPSRGKAPPIPSTPSPVPPPSPPVAPPPPPAAGKNEKEGLIKKPEIANPRNALLKSITEPKLSLRHVDVDDSKKTKTIDEAGDMAVLFAKAILRRREHMREEEDEDDERPLDEWM